ncbi:MAG: hypothetical protein MJE68_33885, partial [Proteobacteria bacterium]|nr:hypothetical protein [Pseudomonadota bacterium]
MAVLLEIGFFPRITIKNNPVFKYFSRAANILKVPKNVSVWVPLLYEDHFLMPLIMAALKDEAANKLDWICFNIPGGEITDLDFLFRCLRSHYCGSLTFRDQWNMVENMRQTEREEVTDFLIRVG